MVRFLSNNDEKSLQYNRQKKGHAMQTSNDGGLLNLNELANRLQIHPKTIWIRRRKKMKKYIILMSILLSISVSAIATDIIGYATYYTRENDQTKNSRKAIRTANGEIFNELDMTCAMPSRNFGGTYLVIYNGRSITVRHNDYNPGKYPEDRGIVIWLTPVAFYALTGDLSLSMVKVIVRGIPRSSQGWPPSGNQWY